jgi:hypothetical protein
MCCQFGHNDKQVTAAQFKQNLSSLVAGVRQAGGLEGCSPFKPHGYSTF